MSNQPTMSNRFSAAVAVMAFSLVLVRPVIAADFTVEQVMSAPFAQAPTVSPNGERVAWLLNEKGHRNIWIASAPDWKARNATGFTEDDGQEIAELAWAPDGSYLIFTRGGDFENGGENPNPDLRPTRPGQDIWLLRMDGSAPKKLGEGHFPAVSPKGDAIAFVRENKILLMKPSGEDATVAVQAKGTSEDLEWSPDGSRLAFESNRRDHGFIGVYSPGDKTLRYLDPSTDRDTSPVWSSDSTQIAFVRISSVRNNSIGPGPRREGVPWSVRVAQIEPGKGREVFRAKPGPGSVFHPIVADHQIFWTEDKKLVFPWEQTGWCHLYSVSASGGEPRELTPGEGEVEHVALSPDRKTIFYASNIGDIDRRHIWRVNTSSNTAPEKVTKGDGIEWSPAPLATSGVLVYLASSYNERSHAVMQAADGKARPLAPETVPSDFPASSLVRPEPVMIAAADGMQIHGQLFLPHDKAGRHPALIFFHGGSRRQMLLGFHYMYYYSNAYSMNQFLANRGYVVLSVNYRSGIGYGLNFREAINYGAHGASEYNDVIGAGLYLKSRADVDPTRIGVWGGSYGGYLTALALARGSDLFAAGVDFHGVHDWSSLRDAPQAPAGGDPEAVEERAQSLRLAWDSSPLASVKTWRSPVLLIHGDDDRNVAFAQTEALVDALRKQNVEFEELIFPNEIHDFLLYRHWVEAYKATSAFFARKLSPTSTGG